MPFLGPNILFKYERGRVVMKQPESCAKPDSGIGRSIGGDGAMPLRLPVCPAFSFLFLCSLSTFSNYKKKFNTIFQRVKRWNIRNKLSLSSGYAQITIIFAIK